MAGPFPGMDPYLEMQAAWPDFHNRLIAEIRNELGARLPDSYVARVDERIEVASWALEPPRSFRPDVLVGRIEKRAVSPGVTLSTAPAATLEPKLVEILDRDPEEVRVTWVEIRALPELELVTAIEVLSPINKSGQRAPGVSGQTRQASCVACEPRGNRPASRRRAFADEGADRAGSLLRDRGARREAAVGGGVSLDRP